MNSVFPIELGHVSIISLVSFRLDGAVGYYFIPKLIISRQSRNVQKEKRKISLRKIFSSAYYRYISVVVLYYALDSSIKLLKSKLHTHIFGLQTSLIQALIKTK